MVNDCLITLCLGGAAGVYVLDIDAVYEHLTTSMASRLHRRWPRMGAQARRFVRFIDPNWFHRTADGGMRRGAQQAVRQST